MRTAHYLRGNSKSESVQQFVCFDTETLPESTGEGMERDHLWFGWACYQRRRSGDKWTEPEWFRFTAAGQYWKWIIAHARAGTTLYTFCHNTSYDLPVVRAFTATRRMGLKLTMAIIDSPPTILKWTKGKATIKCLDTLNWWRQPLREVAKMVGTEKLPMPDAKDSREKWDDYCKQDVEVLRRALLAWWGFLVHNDLGNFRPTLAAQALGTFKHRFMHTYMLAHTDAGTLKMERDAYHGGRCECFYVGRKAGRFWLLDVNSMYPAVMREHVYPTRLHWRAKEPSLRLLITSLQYGCVIADVTLRTEIPAYAVVQGGKLIFPVGEFRAVLTTGELARAVEHGEITAVHALARYESQPCFRDFVDYFYAQRLAAQEQGNGMLAWQFKILMNSLYGKFGQTGRVWAKHKYTNDLSARLWTEVDVDEGKVRKFRQLAGLVQSYLEDSESHDSMPAIAAHVCANARLLLWSYIEQAGRDHVYYCDTDSLLVDQTGMRRLREHIDPMALGKLKREYFCREIEIWGAKDYRFGEQVRHKGIRAAAEQIAPDTWRQWQWSSLIGVLRSGQVDHPTRRMVTKTLKRNYDKGTILPTSRVTPLRMAP